MRQVLMEVRMIANPIGRHGHPHARTCLVSKIRTVFDHPQPDLLLVMATNDCFIGKQ